MTGIAQRISDHGRRAAVEARGRVNRWLRRPRNIATIGWRQVDSLEALLSARTASILELYPPATLPANDELLFPELANEEIRRKHFRVHPAPAGVGLAHLRDVIVSGSSLLGDPLSIYRLGPLAPLYVDLHVTHDHPSNELPVGDRRLHRKRRRVVSGFSVLLTHCNSAVYGHWLRKRRSRSRAASSSSLGLRRAVFAR